MAQILTPFQERKKQIQERKHKQSAKDRLQPALFDRLIDNEPHKKTEAREAVFIGFDDLRIAVLRDLAWLLNTINLESMVSLDSFDEVKRSTINYGVVPLAGQRMSEIDVVDLKSNILNAILAFEPRFEKGSVTVELFNPEGHLEHHNVLTLEVRGLLWCTPYSREILMRTSLDLESGHTDVLEVGVSS